MRGRIFTTVVLSALVLTASSKEYLYNQDTSIFTNHSTEKDSKAVAYSSDWESVSDWNIEKSNGKVVFLFSRTTPELNKAVLENGVVVVFARNLWAGDPAFQNMGSTEKPLHMPFYFLPNLDKPAYSEQWNYATSENKIGLQLTIQDSAPTSAPNKKAQFRYFVISNEMLAQKGQTVETVRKMSYNDLTTTFGLK